MDRKKAIQHINKNGILLVYPIKNKKEPNSLWQELFPRKKMRWEWDANGDQSVSDLWLLREQLSTSNKVVYAKWFQGRATFFSNELFIAILRVYQEHGYFRSSLNFTAREIIEILEENSPVSTKKLKKYADLVGRENESKYSRALKDLWNRFLIVAYGEVDEGAFPSIAIGATSVIFEDLVDSSKKLSLTEAQKTIDRLMPKGGAFRKYFDKNLEAHCKSLRRFDDLDDVSSAPQ